MRKWHAGWWHTWLSLQGLLTVLISIYSHFFSLSLPPTHKIHLQSLIFHSHRPRCQEDEHREKERAVYVWRDQLLWAACAHLNTPLSHWTNEADGSTVACLENYTIITGFTNISPPHAAPSFSLTIFHTSPSSLVYSDMLSAHLLVSSALFKPCNTEYCLVGVFDIKLCFTVRILQCNTLYWSCIWKCIWSDSGGTFNGLVKLNKSNSFMAYYSKKPRATYSTPLGPKQFNQLHHETLLLPN